MFTKCEWNEAPASIEKLNNGSYRVNRNVRTMEKDGITTYVGETAVMTEVVYSAYIGAREVEISHEDEIIDNYTQELIEEGII